MRSIKIALTTILLTTLSSAAYANCGGYWSFDTTYDKRDNHRLSESTFINSNRDDTDTYGIGISFRLPIGDADCEHERAEAEKDRATARKERALAQKAEDEAKYAADRAAKEKENAISKRIDNLQRLIVTCKTEDIAICSQIDQLSLELFN